MSFLDKAIRFSYRIGMKKVLERIQYHYNDQNLLAVKETFNKTGKNFNVSGNFIFKNPQYISIGDNFNAMYNLRIEAWDQYLNEKFEPEVIIRDNVSINTDCHIGCINRVEICDNVLIASRVYITDHSHGNIDETVKHISPVKRYLVSKGPVVIQKNVWIGEGVCVLPGVIIGENSIIGANAVVNKNIPPNSVAVGIPARVIKSF